MPGLSRFKHTFKQFKCLKVLNLSNNKLCNEEGNDTKEFRDCLQSVAHSLEDLLIMENQIEDPEMIDFIMEPISKMNNLKSLNLSRNKLTGLGIVSLLNRIITVQKEATPGPIKLKKLNLTGCWLKDDGIADLLTLVVSEFPLLNSLIISANRLTENCQQNFCNFLEFHYPENRKLLIELRLQAIKKSKISGATQDAFTIFKQKLSQA